MSEQPIPPGLQTTASTGPVTQSAAPQSPAPFNADALAATVGGAVKGAIAEIQAEQQRQAQQAQVAQQQARVVQQQWQDPVAQTVRPYIEPVVQALNLQIQAANDKSDFYMTFPEAAVYKQEVESMFGQLMQQGRPMEREAVWHYFKGKNAEAIAQRQQEQQQQASAQAQGQFATIGGPSAARPEVINTEQFRSLPLDKQRDALAGLSF